MSKPKKKLMKSRIRATGEWITLGQKGPNAYSIKILQAINNTKYAARTFEGIAKEVGVNRGKIIEVIKNDPTLRDNIKMFRRKSTDGKILVTTKKRFFNEASIKDKFVDIFSSHGVKIEDV